MDINKRQIVSIITEELKKKDVIDMLQNDKEAERKVRAIVKDVVKDMFRVLWQHNGIFDCLGKK